MALSGRKLTAPQPVELIFSGDPSIIGGLTSYRSSLRRSDLTTDGAETVFHCRSISGEQWLSIRQGAISDNLASVALALAHGAFRTGVLRISGWLHDDGTTGDLPREEWEDRLPDLAIDEIGRHLIEISTRKDGDGLGKSQPPSSSEATAS